jgi:transcriptional regulator with GAF, ATPase, and Fis domain
MALTTQTTRKSLDNQQNIFELMGESFSVYQIHRKIQQVARTNFTTILQGETGTGKELVAHLIHDHSDRANQPFLAVDCGAIPDTLVESELFGYVKGAFGRGLATSNSPEEELCFWTRLPICLPQCR